MRSLPAKSTNCNLADVSCAPSAEKVCTDIVKIVCEREDVIFNLCEAVTRFFTPDRKNDYASLALLTL
jgi:hypothetical protein